jgi:hypothetical protein
LALTAAAIISEAKVRGEFVESLADRRNVPITPILRDFLLEHRLQVPRGKTTSFSVPAPGRRSMAR